MEAEPYASNALKLNQVNWPLSKNVFEKWVILLPFLMVAMF